ncbi:Filament-like plant protein 7 [Sesamum alatum]|uniref:Filament-like plant protein 7 n=1 Tax=Sesamum alatum TaxID=300844 RepID=A0AAE2CX53_9LAMI|nr:Filament-like plant protein 7 [Sesamum alatum]
MDQKTWLWRKRSSEKTIVANGEEVESVPVQREVDLENSLKTLNEKLASVLDECSAKDKLVQDYEKMVEDAVAGKNKAEEDVGLLKKELDEVQQQRAAANDRLGHLNTALKDCMEQLNLVRDGQEQRIHDAVMKTSQEFEKAHKRLEEKLLETSKRLADVTSESSYLSKALLVKEKLIEDLNHIKSQTEAEFEALMTRLDSVEKENAFLRYEFRTLEKELDLRNEEVLYGRRAVEASNKQHSENIKKIKKLEADCQRLRALTRKRLPGPAILANIKSDIEVHGRSPIENRRKAISIVKDSSTIYSPDKTSKKLSFLVDHLQDLEKENKILKQYLAKKGEEIFYHQNSKNSPFQEKFELTRPNPAPDELSFPSGYDIVEANEITTSSSWATAIIPEQGHDKFTDPQTEPVHKMIGASEMSLMDDFVEMEKLAIVAVESPLENHTDSMTKELIPVGHAEFSDMNHELKAKEKPKDWLQDVKNMILEQHNISKRSLDELLGDIRMALNNIILPEPSKLLPISGYITWKSPASSPRSSSIQESSNEFQHSDANASVRKIMELVGRFDLPCSEDCKMQDELLVGEYNNSPCEERSKVSDYSIRVLRWKGSSLTTVLQEFIYSCNDLLDGKINYEKFTGDLSSALGWIVNNCISYQDDFTVRDAFRKHLGGDGPGTALELESVQNLMLEMEKMYSIFQAEIKGLMNDLNLIKTSVNVNLQAERQNDKPLMQKLEQSRETITSLENELEILKESERTTEDQIENLKVINEDLDTQLTVTRAKLNEVLQKLSSMEVELENKRHCCEELEGTCLELQLQLESITSNQHSQENENQEGLLGTGMEITRASVKLAECEKTILKLGNQLKALGSARQLSVVDKVLSIADTKNKKSKPRSSLLDQMISEDNSEVKHLQSPPKTKVESKLEANASQVATPEASLGTKNENKSTKAGTLVIVPIKKRGGGIGLLRKLLLRRKKGSSNSSSIYFGK